MADFADDLAWLCTELALTKPIVVSHSMGGIVALELAARYPEIPALLFSFAGRFHWLGIKRPATEAISAGVSGGAVSNGDGQRTTGIALIMLLDLVRGSLW